MIKENKELLLKDLCSRLPYEIKGKTAAGEVNPLIRRGQADYDIITSIKIIIEKHGWRPYLFPLSSMTEEQYTYCESLMEEIEVPFWGVIYSPTHDYYDYLNKNHFDYRGLISMGLAIDCTNLNIY